MRPAPRLEVSYMSDYLVPLSFGEIEYVEKRSRFIGRVWPVENEAEALERLRETRERHWDASHNVYAYAIRSGGVMRFSDDGEPSGTAGMPVLDVFRKAGVQDFCCVVTRYFGGILLGAGGLVRAYSKAASMALDAAGRARMTRLYDVSLICSYPQYERIKAELPRFEARLENAEFGADVELSLSMTPENFERFGLRVTELTSATALCEAIGEDMRPIRIDPDREANP